LPWQHIGTFAIPEHFKAIWHEREGGLGNAITTLYLVLMLYLLPFVLGMLGMLVMAWTVARGVCP
jgi:hypothetical protein